MFRRFFFLALFGLTSCNQFHDQKESLVAIQLQDRNGMTETISAPDKLEALQAANFLANQPYKKVTRVFREEGRNQAKITTYHPNGSLHQYLETQEMRALGAYREWYANGQQKIEALVIGGTAELSLTTPKDWLFDGTSQVWNEEGILIASIPYNKGVLEGKSHYYYSNGQLERVSSYEKDVLQGTCFHYFEDGTLQEKGTFIKGIKEGVFEIFHSEKTLASKETYQQGRLLEGKYWDFQGKLVAEVEKGFGVRAHFAEKHLESLEEIAHGELSGKIKVFFPDQTLKSTYFLKNGFKQGEEVHYYPQTKHPKLSIYWNKGLVHGQVKTWYNDGSLQSQKTFSKNQKEGSSCAWYKNGALMLMEEYVADLLISGSYYKQGTSEPISSVINGNGTAHLFDEEGMLLHKVCYVKGTVHIEEE